MKIAWFTETWLPVYDGVVSSLLTFKNELERRGHEIYIFAPGEENRDDRNIFYYKGWKYPRYPDYRIISPSSLLSKRTLRIIDKISPDIIHSHTPGILGLHALLAARHAGKPLVFTFHTFLQDSTYFFSEGMKDAVSQAVDRWFSWYISKCEYVIVPSKYVAGLIKHENVEVIPTGIDIKKFRRKKKKGKEKMVLHVGRVVREKNIDVIIKAAPLILENQNATFTIVGKGPALNELKEMVLDYDLNEYFNFTGFVDEETLLDYYASADVFAFPSTYETQGIVALEAMASGLPVVGANARAIPEFVIDGVNGYLFEPGNHVEMAEKILMAFSSDLSEGARMMAERYSISKMTDKLLALYEGINDGKI
ncbi:MAG: glycosyltransferase [Thermoplasmata archaeon]|nr:glycosyltransferase [Thermoplasmata archaeon]